MFSCSEDKKRIITWDKLNKDYPCPGAKLLNEVPEEAFPWTGTVSHHLLAGEYIDSFFQIISARRKVEYFFIISPSHHNLSKYSWSIADITWESKIGLVHTDKKIVNFISKKLGVPKEEEVFTYEHGINCLIPFIKKYFPEAKIVPIAVNGEPPLNQYDSEKLYQCLKEYFTPENRKKNFLLISTDFSHHGNPEETEFKDRRSLEFFNKPKASSYIYCGCDNRPGIYILSHLLDDKSKVKIIYHTDSFKISGQQQDDITSYYFSLFY